MYQVGSVSRVSLITLPLTSDSGEETGDRYRHLTAAPLRHRGYIWSLHLLKKIITDWVLGFWLKSLVSETPDKTSVLATTPNISKRDSEIRSYELVRI